MTDPQGVASLYISKNYKTEHSEK